MDPKTARKYLRARRLPSEMQKKHTWRTRPDPFAEIWEELRQLLRVEPAYKQGRCSSIYSKVNRVGSPTGSCARSSAGLSIGGQQKGRRKKSSLLRSTGPASFASPILRIAANSV